MDQLHQLRTLLWRFKDFNGEAAANVESLSTVFQNMTTGSRLGKGFDILASCSSCIYEQLAATSVFGSLATELLKEFEELEELMSVQVTDLPKLLKHLKSISIIALEFQEELENPTCKISTCLILLFEFFRLFCKCRGIRKE